MLSVYSDSVDKVTTAVISESDLDVSKKILKRMGIGSILDDSNLSDKTVYNIMEGFCLNKIDMPKRSKAIVRCNEKDTYSIEDGRKEAIAKAQKNYFQSTQKALRRWQTAMIKKIYAVSPDTFEDAVKEVNRSIAK